MGDDIVTRLRTVPTWTAENCAQLSEITDEAADLIKAQQAEIERLLAELDQLRWDNKRLADLYDGLYYATTVKVQK